MFTSSRYMVLAFGLIGVGPACLAQPVDTLTLSNAIAGVYPLEEWHTDSGVLRPPQVDGRFVLVDGNVLFTLRTWTDQNRGSMTTGVGTYKLAPGLFSYSYDSWASFTETPSSVTASHVVPLAGIQQFDASQLGSQLVLRNARAAEFVFADGTIRYSVKDKLVRLWRRLQPR